MKCKYCKHYEFMNSVEACCSHGKIQFGKCTKSGRGFGNLTMAEMEGCPVFERRIVKHKQGDVFVGDYIHNVNYEEHRERRAFCIIAINPEYYPALYRVRDSRRCEYSVDDEWFDDKKKVVSGEEARE